MITKKIIGLAGRKQVGKSTAAEALEGLDFELCSFAYTLKLMARILMGNCGLSEKQKQHAERHKEDILPLIGVSYRYLLQTLGTDWGREKINENLWILAAAHDASVWNQVVFDDVRFECEAAWIREQGGLIVHIERPSLAADDAHASEAGIVYGLGDVLVVNDGSEDHLYDKIRAIGLQYLGSTTGH
jgi:hypothetical protein